MVKSLIVAGHLIGVFFLSFVFSDEITITDTFPESLQVGETYMVTVSITKNDVTGFAKYQIDAPRGVVIKPVELSSASFTFKDGKAKFIWMNLPTVSNFDITYEITVEDGEIGSEKEVNSRLSYLIDNARKIHQGPNHILKIANEDGAVATHSTTSSEISATRKITPEGDNKFLVEIAINKLGVKGFAKIQDMIPNGFVATEVMNSEAIFTQTDTKVKLVWFDIPKNMSLNVSYLLEAPADYNGSADIAGKFHYMAGSDLKKVPIPNEIIQIGGAIATNVDSNNAEETETANEAATENTSANVDSTEPVAEDNTTNTLDDLVSEVNGMTTKADEIADTNTDMTDKADEIEIGSNDASHAVDDAANTATDAMINTAMDNNVTQESIENSENTSTSFLDDFVTSQSSDTESNEEMSGKEGTVVDGMNSTVENVTTTANNTAQETPLTNSTNEDVITAGEDMTNNTMVDDVSGNNSATETVDEIENNSTINEITDNVAATNDITNDVSSTTNDVDNINPSELATGSNVTSTENMTSDNENMESTSNRSSIDDLLSNSTSVNKSTDSESDNNTAIETTSSSTSEDEGFSNINTTSTDMTTAVAEPESTKVATPTYEKEEVIAEENNFDEISNFSNPESGINYRVQIMAGKKVVGKEYLRKRHNFSSNFYIENHEGWIKYTSGSFDEYKSARDQRNVIRLHYDFNGPFVSAYNDGVRITVQEALMISKQQWYN